MTHGDKAKGKKTASQASGSKKSGKAVQAVAKETKGGKAVQVGGKIGKANGKAEKGPEKAADKGGSKAVAAKTQQTGREKAAAAPQAGAKGQARTAVSGHDATDGFTNPVVASAFKRAVKKYSNAFRRLTD